MTKTISVITLAAIVAITTITIVALSLGHNSATTAAALSTIAATAAVAATYCLAKQKHSTWHVHTDTPPKPPDQQKLT